MRNQNIFWGVLLVLIGSLLLLDRLHIFTFSWWTLSKLWPLLFIFWGISILPIKKLFKLLLIAFAVALGVFAYFQLDAKTIRGAKRTSTTELPAKDNLQQYFAEPYNPEVEFASLDLAAAAGKFSLEQSTSDLINVDNNSEEILYEFRVEEQDKQARVFVKQNHDATISAKKFKNDLNIALNTNPVWRIKADVGAADVDFDLEAFKVEMIDINCGAAAIEISLGTLQPRSDIHISAGASSIELNIPEEAGCHVEGSSVLSNRQLDGFEKLSKGVYETPDFREKSQQIVVKMDAAVTNFVVHRY